MITKRTLEEWIKFVSNWSNTDNARGVGKARSEELDKKSSRFDEGKNAVITNQHHNFPGAGLE